MAEPTNDCFAEGAMGVEEATEFTGLGVTFLYALMNRGELRYSKVGKRRLIPKRDLVELLRRGQQDGQGK